MGAACGEKEEAGEGPPASVRRPSPETGGRAGGAGILGGGSLVDAVNVGRCRNVRGGFRAVNARQCGIAGDGFHAVNARQRGNGGGGFLREAGSGARLRIERGFLFASIWKESQNGGRAAVEAGGVLKGSGDDPFVGGAEAFSDDGAAAGGSGMEGEHGARDVQPRCGGFRHRRRQGGIPRFRGRAPPPRRAR